MGPVAKLLPCGLRLHLQHGPIDLIIGADGDRTKAFDAAQARFATVLDELVHELSVLRAPMTKETPSPTGLIARRMHVATMPLSNHFVTRMAAVAGAVADEVLTAMVDAADLPRAYVNNGGDIALHLHDGAQFTTAMMAHTGDVLGQITVTEADPIRGIATSGRHGRSLSFGVADSVTVLATTAARADVAATLIANAVDLPDHAAITRKPANDLVDDSDLGARPVVTDCAPLSLIDCQTALLSGEDRATQFQAQNLISAAGLFLQGHVATTNPQFLKAKHPERLYA
ncbi:UPF0280 family protein [Tateyamaria sp.]|uniref:UPF0280 family protein n=1 Tax=Tateyamaria sp. TaxID=1929288 RepID=UPI00329EEBAC